LNAVKNLQENEMSKIIINNYSNASDEDVVRRLLKTMTEHKKYATWVENGEMQKKLIGYHRSSDEALDIIINPEVLKSGTIKFDVY
jgi:TnpA family transposase